MPCSALKEMAPKLGLPIPPPSVVEMVRKFCLPSWYCLGKEVTSAYGPRAVSTHCKAAQMAGILEAGQLPWLLASAVYTAHVFHRQESYPAPLMSCSQGTIRSLRSRRDCCKAGGP